MSRYSRWNIEEIMDKTDSLNEYSDTIKLVNADDGTDYQMPPKDPEP